MDSLFYFLKEGRGEWFGGGAVDVALSRCGCSFSKRLTIPAMLVLQRKRSRSCFGVVRVLSWIDSGAVGIRNVLKLLFRVVARPVEGCGCAGDARWYFVSTFGAFFGGIRLFCRRWGDWRLRW